MAIGTAALTAARLCADPDLLDRTSDDERAESLAWFRSYFAYLVHNGAARLAPEPVTSYAGCATPAELVRALNAATPEAERPAPWVMHA